MLFYPLESVSDKNGRHNVLLFSLSRMPWKYKSAAGTQNWFLRLSPAAADMETYHFWAFQKSSPYILYILHVFSSLRLNLISNVYSHKHNQLIDSFMLYCSGFCGSQLMKFFEWIPIRLVLMTPQMTLYLIYTIQYTIFTDYCFCCVYARISNSIQ